MARNTGLEETDDTIKRGHLEEERESIWTIPAKLKRWYFAFFSIQIAIATAWLVRMAIVDESRNGVPDILFYLWQYMAPAAVSSATFALVIVDTANGIMVLSTWLEDELKKRRQRQIKSAADKARADGITEERQRWLDWNQRREAAVAAGEDFNELPPGVDQESEDRQQK